MEATRLQLPLEYLKGYVSGRDDPQGITYNVDLAYADASNKRFVDLHYPTGKSCTFVQAGPDGTKNKMYKNPNLPTTRTKCYEGSVGGLGVLGAMGVLDILLDSL